MSGLLFMIVDGLEDLVILDLKGGMNVCTDNEQKISWCPKLKKRTLGTAVRVRLR